MLPKAIYNFYAINPISQMSEININYKYKKTKQAPCGWKNLGYPTGIPPSCKAANCTWNAELGLETHRNLEKKLSGRVGGQKTTSVATTHSPSPSFLCPSFLHLIQGLFDVPMFDDSLFQGLPWLAAQYH